MANYRLPGLNFGCRFAPQWAPRLLLVPRLTLKPYSQDSDDVARRLKSWLLQTFSGAPREDELMKAVFNVSAAAYPCPHSCVRWSACGVRDERFEWLNRLDLNLETTRHERVRTFSGPLGKTRHAGCQGLGKLETRGNQAPWRPPGVVISRFRALATTYRAALGCAGGSGHFVQVTRRHRVSRAARLRISGQPRNPVFRTCGRST